MISAESCSALLYNSAIFLDFLKDFFTYHPCLLCGQVHEFHNHGQVTRFIRDNRSYTNIAINIFVSCCPNNKSTGKQYTKRILPPFLIPECNITLENCLKMADGKGNLDIDDACEILGTVCERTVRRHSRQLKKVLQLTINWITTWLAEYPLVAFLPGKKPGKTLYEDLLDTYQALLSANQKMRGTIARPPAIIWLPSYILVLTKARTASLLSSDLVCLINILFDTS
jgi:hypothetical protein